MVSEMRAKVRNLEQKLHTRVPRLRSGTSDRGLFGGSSPNPTAKKPLQPDSPGWVLVMEESPPPRRVAAPRRTNSPPPAAFPRVSSSTSGNVSSDAESPTVYRIPGPRRSFTRSVASSTASIPTPSTSRPSSPDFNPTTPVESRSFNVSNVQACRSLQAAPVLILLQTHVMVVSTAASAPPAHYAAKVPWLLRPSQQ